MKQTRTERDLALDLIFVIIGQGVAVLDGDLGIDVPAEKFVETAKSESAKVVACSALLTTTMTEMENVVKAAAEAGIRDDIKVMVGGAPVTDSYCKSIGADMYAPDAASAADAALELLV